jgi:hypothetical protein
MAQQDVSDHDYACFAEGQNYFQPSASLGHNRLALTTRLNAPTVSPYHYTLHVGEVDKAQSHSRLIELQQQHPQLAAKLLQPSHIHQQLSTNPPSNVRPFGSNQLNGVPLRDSYVPHIDGNIPHAQQRQTSLQQSQSYRAPVAPGFENAKNPASMHRYSQTRKPCTTSAPRDSTRDPVSHSVIIGSQPESWPLKYDIATLEESNDSLDEELKVKRDYLGEGLPADEVRGQRKRRPRLIKLRQKVQYQVYSR